MIAGILSCLVRLPNSRGCKTTLWGRDCPSQQKGDWRGRVSFTRAECLNVDRRTSLIMTPKRSPPCLAVPAWSGRTFPVIRCTIPGVGQKDSQSGPERKSHTQEYLETNYPKESWTHGYTDGSAENAVRNGGAGVYIKYAGGKEDKISLATGLYSTNYKAEAEALKTAAAHIEASTHTSLKVVLLTDALSVLQALQSNRDTEINDLSTALASLCRRHEVTLQWIPSHCNLPGNEAADSLAKEGTTKEQVDRSTSYPEVKTILKAKQHSKWRHKHPRYNKADPYYQLTRREQVTVFRLRTGHNRLNYHLYSKLRIGHTEQCPCGTGSQTTEHLLQFCPTYEPLRKGIWPDHTPLARKLYGSLRDLRCTATFIGETGISIWRTRRRSLHIPSTVVSLLQTCPPTALVCGIFWSSSSVGFSRYSSFFPSFIS